MTNPALPAALQGLKETLPGPVAEPAGSFCTFHGAQTGPNCPLCDKEFPGVAESRLVQGPSVIPTADVQAMVDAAVKQALGEQVAFQRWKESPEGQAAAAAAATAGQSAPNHGA
jgi:hypothetical protein